jgi:toxin-antitoxin system PIN domain toxin
MPLVDTNILLYAVNADSPLKKSCESCLASLRQGQAPWHTTWGVVYEFLRVATHPRIFSQPLRASQAWEFLKALFDAPGFSMLTATARHPEVVSEVVREFPVLSGNLWHDAETAILMREHGIGRIYTRDVDFHRFPFLEVVDPTR